MLLLYPQVKWQVYAYYLASVGAFLSIATIAMKMAFQGFSIGSNLWLSKWSSDNTTVVNGTQDTSKRDFYLSVYAAFGLGQGTIICLISNQQYVIYICICMLRKSVLQPLPTYKKFSKTQKYLKHYTHKILYKPGDHSIRTIKKHIAPSPWVSLPEKIKQLLHFTENFQHILINCGIIFNILAPHPHRQILEEKSDNTLNTGNVFPDNTYSQYKIKPNRH